MPNWAAYLHYPDFNAGTQIVNLGEGGPASHMGLQAIQPRVYPVVYGVGTYGLGDMPRQVLGPSLAIQPNNVYGTQNSLTINGLRKASA